MQSSPTLAAGLNGELQNPCSMSPPCSDAPGQRRWNDHDSSARDSRPTAGAAGFWRWWTPAPVRPARIPCSADEAAAGTTYRRCRLPEPRTFSLAVGDLDVDDDGVEVLAQGPAHAGVQGPRTNESPTLLGAMTHNGDRKCRLARESTTGASCRRLATAFAERGWDFRENPGRPRPGSCGPP